MHPRERIRADIETVGGRRRLYLDPTLHLQARVTRWAYPELPCKQMALDRATGAIADAPERLVARPVAVAG